MRCPLHPNSIIISCHPSPRCVDTYRLCFCRGASVSRARGGASAGIPAHAPWVGHAVLHIGACFGAACTRNLTVLSWRGGLGWSACGLQYHLLLGVRVQPPHPDTTVGGANMRCPLHPNSIIIPCHPSPRCVDTYRLCFCRGASVSCARGGASAGIPAHAPWVGHAVLHIYRGMFLGGLYSKLNQIESFDVRRIALAAARATVPPYRRFIFRVCSSICSVAAPTFKSG
jgi:hypothetical protein